MTEGVPILVAGRHRIEVARRLGWTDIDTLVLDGDETDARLWEIAENLHRAELTVQERADHIAEWIAITAEKVGQLDPLSRGRGIQGGVRAATRELGVERMEARRAIKIASITHEARQAADTAGLVSQRARLEIASAPAEQQVQRVADVAASRVKPAPVALNEFETLEQWVAAGMRWWNRGSQDWREDFLRRLDDPVFDNTQAGLI